MSTTIKKFVDRCDEIVVAQPAYELGHSSLIRCDCIGMIKYSLEKNNVPFTTTGTNWTYRNQVTNTRRITNASVLKVGDVVFKSRAPGESGYNLPTKYRIGGSAYNGDLTDYCHIGVVKSVSPLEIIHMTSPSAKRDKSIGKWKWAAELKSQYILNGSMYDTQIPIPEPEPTKQTGEAIVVAESGRWVKMRKEPTTKCGIYDDVPIGAKVTIVTNGYDWAKINYGKRKGWYMMTKFLDTVNDGKGKY